MDCPRRVVPFLLLAAPLFAATVPRAEHPQPQFVRDHWLSLNGEWQFSFNTPKYDRKIVVPYCPESKLSGIADTAFHPVVWYRRSISVPWKTGRTMLRFGAVDYRAKVWVNDKMAGEHEGGNVPFAFDVTALLKPTGNVITLRAEDPPTDRSIPRGKQYWEPKSKSIFYTRTTGIWQPVWLEEVGEAHLKTVRATPHADGTVELEPVIEGASDGLEFTATLADGTAAVKNVLKPANPHWWSVEDPFLYDVTYELRRGGVVVDRVKSYFGLRTVEVKNGRVNINGKPIYLKMVLDQGYWPESILTPPTDEAIQYDIRMTKAMGFNGARKHQKLEDPRFLYWADKMGLLVSSEMANAYVFTPEYVARFTREWIEAMERDYSHPSVIMWVPINESWGMPNPKDPRQVEHLRAMYALAKSLDASRPVIDNDGWEHADQTDLFAIHDYTGKGEDLYARYKDVKAGTPGAKIPKNHKEALLPGYAYNGTPIYLSEFGGVAWILPGSLVPSDAWGYQGVEKSPEAVLARLHGIYEAIAKLPFAGICYTQLTDVEQEINGLMSYDRKMKYKAEDIKALNDLLQ
ncbi:MAG: glycoside hydrolase family 2 TIM barrel-domain containing protein [Bryobacteraceae bacterium]